MTRPARETARAKAPKRKEQRPEPLWGAFPLSQILVLAGLVLLLVGMFSGNRREVLIGLGLGCLSGLELSIREHFGGYRSHTTLLAGVGFAVVTSLLYFTAGQVLWLSLLAGAIVAVAAALLLVKLFREVSGGLSYRIR